MKTSIRKWILLTAIVLLIPPVSSFAQDEQKQKSMEIYGFIMMDAGYNANQIHPDWFDVVRPTKLPAYKDEYGTNGNFYFSVRQTRLGFKNYFETPLGELKTHFEFEMFGTGVDAGQTTIRLRHAYAELGKFGVGQYWSPFMDIDVFPNTAEYWGPNGMVFFRNVQFRWMPIQGDTRLTFALERPGASADQGIYSDRVELQGVKGRFAMPDFSFEYRKAGTFGYVEVAGIARSIKWEDQNNDAFDLSGSALGWGINLSTNLKLGKNDVFRGAAVYGEGIQNYFNDAPVDIGIQNNPGNTTSPVKGVALPILGITAFLDHTWSEKFTTAIGYSSVNIENSDGQAADAFAGGNYIAANLMYYPVKNTMMGVEYQYGDRKNFSDGWTTSISKVQFSFKYNFSQSFYKN
jgi:DcaP outer membrane protein